MGDPVVGPAITAGTNVILKLAPDFERRREDADDLHDNGVRLQNEISLLTARRQDVQEEIERNKVNKMKKMTAECGAWLKTVQKLLDNAEKLDAKYRKITRKHYITNPLYSKAQLSRKMKKKADEIASLRSVMTPDKAMIYVATMVPFLTLSSEEIDELPWIKRNVDGIWTRLKNERLKKIGIYAFTGMGKTTIMHSLHDKARKDREFFEHVFFTSIQDNDKEETIQKCILYQLGIDVKDIPSPTPFADTISGALQDKKYLLLIDQLTKKIDLRKLGIRDDHCGRKVVIAAREKVVCEEMGMDESIPVNNMCNDEVWDMFRQIAGQVVECEQIKPYAQVIAQECGRNPKLIKAVAAHLKDKGEDKDIWRDCKDKLQLCEEPYVQSFDDAYNVFKFLFHKLNDSRKGCFLYGALFPQNHEIWADNLMECWRAEDFIPGAGGSNDQQIFRRARGDGRHAMEHLIDGCLFERGTTAKYVKMPPLFRRWAFRTGDGVNMLVALSDEEIRNYPKVEHRRNRTRISLRCSDLSEMLKGVSPDKISSLLLQRNERLDNVLASIFVRASQLRVLNFGYSGITSVPSSISKLTGLKALYLNDCPDLCALPTQIKKLTHLETLDISRTGIPSWPAEIGDLSGLKCLRMSFTENVVNGNETTGQTMFFFSSLMKVFSRDHTVVHPTGIIDRLCQLEELTIFVDGWCPSWWTGVADTIVGELASLKFLTTLCFYFPTVNCLKDFVEKSSSWNNIDNIGEARSFKIVVGSFKEENIIDLSQYKAERHLKVFAPQEPLEAISPILKQAYTFELIGNQIIEHLTGLGVENMTGLKICAIQGCHEMRSIIRTDNNATAVVLPKLERLHLFDLRNLITIFDGKLGGESFAKLTNLTIFSCQGLCIILPLELAQLVPQLEHLRVENCLNAQAVIECERHHDGGRVTALDSNLKRLELINLPNLGWIGRDISLMCLALQDLEVDKCDRLRDFPSVVTQAMKLAWFRCKHSLWDQLSEECRSRPHLFHSVIEEPDHINNDPDHPPQQDEQHGNGLNPNN